MGRVKTSKFYYVLWLCLAIILLLVSLIFRYRTQTCFSNFKSFCIKIMWDRRLAPYHVSIILNNIYYCGIFNVCNFSVTNPIYRILRRGPLKATDEIQYYVVSKEKKTSDVLCVFWILFKLLFHCILSQLTYDGTQ